MTADHITRAAEIIYVEVLGLPDYSPDAVDDHNRHSYRGDCECNASDRADARHAAEELDSGDLLATPEHDAKVAAGELRRFTEAELMDLWWTASDDGWAVPEDLPKKFLAAVADQIEREIGETDANA